MTDSLKQYFSLAIKIIYDYIFLDTISCMDDNITPSTIDKNKTTSPMKSLKTTPVLKRNMEEVFDLDLNDHLSSSKTPKVYPNCPKKIVVKGKVGEKWLSYAVVGNLNRCSILQLHKQLLPLICTMDFSPCGFSWFKNLFPMIVF